MILLLAMPIILLASLILFRREAYYIGFARLIE
jgi:hypothetical protein